MTTDKPRTGGRSWSWEAVRAVNGAAALFAAALLTTGASAKAINGDRIVTIDGDTVALPCETPSQGCAEKIRFLDIDALESFRSHCENERRAGLAAKARVVSLLHGATVYVERSGRRDRYDRTLANLTTAQGDVVGVLLQEGLALPYRPGAGAKAARIAHWCG